MEPEAELALRREAVITAVVAAEGIEPPEEDLLAALAPIAEREDLSRRSCSKSCVAPGRLEEVREDLAARQAIDVIADAAKPIPLAQAQAREQLWTPGKEGDGAAPRGEAARSGACTVVDTRSLASRGIWSARRNKGEDMRRKRGQ